MSDEMPEHDADKALAGEYALGLLPPAEAAAFERRLESEPDLRVLYAEWADDLVGLTDAISPVEPPPRVWTATQARLFNDRTPRKRGWLGVLSGSLAASVLALGLLVMIDFNRPPQPPASPDYVAQLAAEDRSLVVFAAYDAGTGSLYVAREQGGPAEGRALELWLIAGEDAPVSLGLLPDDAVGALDVPSALRSRLAGGVLAISDEPPGGSPTGAPTGDVLAVGQITDT